MPLFHSGGGSVYLHAPAAHTPTITSTPPLVPSRWGCRWDKRSPLAWGGFVIHWCWAKKERSH